jgi:hypothetical protein
MKIGGVGYVCANKLLSFSQIRAHLPTSSSRLKPPYSSRPPECGGSADSADLHQNTSDPLLLRIYWANGLHETHPNLEIQRRIPFSAAKWNSQSMQTPSSLSANSQFLALDNIICPPAVSPDSRLDTKEKLSREW